MSIVLTDMPKSRPSTSKGLGLSTETVLGQRYNEFTPLPMDLLNPDALGRQFAVCFKDTMGFVQQ